MIKYFLFTLFFTINYILAIDSLNLIGNPSSLTIDSAIPGEDFQPAEDNSTIYEVTVDGPSQKKITGKLTDKAVPNNTTLEVNLAAPTNASSQGFVSLNTTSKDLVTSIAAGTYDNLSITYKFSATVAAGIITSQIRTLECTLTDN